MEKVAGDRQASGAKAGGRGTYLLLDDTLFTGMVRPAGYQGNLEEN